MEYGLLDRGCAVSAGAASEAEDPAGGPASRPDAGPFLAPRWQKRASAGNGSQSAVWSSISAEGALV
jgi:hypothetical protein